jgi:protocatechuate 3,4-dioxygenase beta subunit
LAHNFCQSQLRAFLFTDEEGRFSFETEWPSLVPPHIHFIVTADGFDRIETQWIGDKRQKVIVFTMVFEAQRCCTGKVS